MRIPFTANIKLIDTLTQERQNVTSEQLINRTGEAVANQIIKDLKQNAKKIIIFAGPGKNGDDGIVAGKILADNGYLIETHHINKEISQKYSSFKAYRQNNKLLNIATDSIIIDALFGSGLNRPLSGIYAEIVDYINNSGVPVFSIDIPSGLLAKKTALAVKATVTYTVEFPKLQLLFAENEIYTGECKIIDIGLDKCAIAESESPFYYTEKEDVKNIITKRSLFSHKGDFGHGLLIAGSYCMAGASIMAALAAERTGIGLLTVHAPSLNNDILQISIPEAMVQHDIDERCFTSISDKDLSKCTAVAVGPGIGTSDKSCKALASLYKMVNGKIPIVIDADALNLTAANPALLASIPQNAILTPHLKEFERLVKGDADLAGDDLTSTSDLISVAKKFTLKYGCFIILKGHFSSVISPSGTCSFNSTGNPGMATGGSGDVLTGILLALSAQGISPEKVAISGTYIHGAAGDIAAKLKGEAGMIARDIIEYIPEAIEYL